MVGLLDEAMHMMTKGPKYFESKDYYHLLTLKEKINATHIKENKS